MGDRPIHPAEEALLLFFEYGHLPPHLQVVSEPFHALAHMMVPSSLPSGAETTTMLRKLLEAKDCAVRAALDNVPEEDVPY